MKKDIIYSLITLVILIALSIFIPDLCFSSSSLNLNDSKEAYIVLYVLKSSFIFISCLFTATQSYNKLH